MIYCRSYLRSLFFSLDENKTKLQKYSIWIVYNLGFRVLLERLCAYHEDLYNLLAWIITFQHPFFPWKENKIRNYDRVSKNIQATADLMREGKREGINSQQSHHSQVIQSNLVRVHEP